MTVSTQKPKYDAPTDRHRISTSLYSACIACYDAMW